MSLSSIFTSILGIFGSLASVFSFFKDKEKNEELKLRNLKLDMQEIKDDFNDLNKASIEKVLKIVRRINKLNINYKDESELNDILEDIMELLNKKLDKIFNYENIEIYFEYKLKKADSFDFENLKKELIYFKAYKDIYGNKELNKYLNEDFMKEFLLKEEFYHINNIEFIEEINKLNIKSEKIENFNTITNIGRINEIIFIMLVNKYKIECFKR